MTTKKKNANRKVQNLARERMKKTGERYTTALMHIQGGPAAERQLVYLDATQLSWAKSHQKPWWSTEVAARLSREYGITWVLSSVHLDDSTHSDERGRLARLYELLTWPESRLLAMGPRLFHLEVEAQVSTVVGESARVAIGDFTLSTDKVECTEAEFVGQAHSAPRYHVLRDLLDERKEQKGVGAIAETFQRQAVFHENHLERDQRRVQKGLHDAFLVGDVTGLKEIDVEERIRELDQDATIPEDQKDIVRQMLVQLKKPGVLEAVAAQVASLNPLRLGAEDFMNFQHWKLHIPEHLQRWVESEGELLQRAFEAWHEDPTSTPGLWTKLEVERCLARNPSAKVKRSESTDTYHISALPYVDVIFADRQIDDAVQKSNLPEGWKRRCRPNGQFQHFLNDLGR